MGRYLRAWGLTAKKPAKRWAEIGAEPFKTNPMTGQMPAAPFSLIAP